MIEEKFYLYNPGSHESLIQDKMNEIIDNHNALEKVLIDFGILSYSTSKIASSNVAIASVKPEEKGNKESLGDQLVVVPYDKNKVSKPIEETYSLDEVARMIYKITESRPCDWDDHLCICCRLDKDFECPFEHKKYSDEENAELEIRCWKHAIQNKWLEKLEKESE